MRKKLSFIILCAFLCTAIPGCANVNNKSGNSVSESSADTPKKDNTDENTDDTGTNTEPDTDKENVPSPEAIKTPEPRTGEFSSAQQYSDAYRVVKFLGLKEYKTLKGDNYTDKAKKNKKFLVLFLSIKNTSNENDYINPNYVTAKVDGEKTSHTFLVNEPKSYPTIFTHIEPGKTIGGFVVWEVPKDWKSFEMEYSAWKNIDGLTLKAKFTPDDLANPTIYNAGNLVG